MKKLIAITLFAVLSFNLTASEIYGNNDIWGNGINDKENNQSDNANYYNSFEDDPIFGGGQWLSSSRPGGWAADDDIGTNEKDPAIPVGEGVLILLAGGALYTATKLRRKK